MIEPMAHYDASGPGAPHPVLIEPILFEETGFRLVGRSRFARSDRIAYSQLTHLVRTRRGLSIGTVDDSFHLRPVDFVDKAGPVDCEVELRQRIARTAGGLGQLARMVEVDARARRAGRPRVALTFSVLCVAAWLLQRTDPFVETVGAFVPALVAQGELWRIVTANFIHEPSIIPFHLGFNLLVILGFGAWVERALGAPRAALLMGVSGAASMAACVPAGYDFVIGASGVGAGLVGALLALELKESRRIPVSWRLPRRLFFTALVLQAAIDLFVPNIAGAAHIAGLLAGYGMARLLASRGLEGRAAGLPVWSGVTLLSLILVVAVIAVYPLASHRSDALERHALRLLHVEDLPYDQDNDVAWMIVTESQPSRRGSELAIALAERAVEKSGHRNPNVLDTLAEALFVSGDTLGALRVIDEAIMLSGGGRYFVQQRLRFLGQRAREDRPAPPGYGPGEEGHDRFVEPRRPEPDVPEPLPDGPSLVI